MDCGEPREQRSTDKSCQGQDLSAALCVRPTSHAQCLQQWAASNNARLIETVGGGDCFFHAVQIGMSALGESHTIARLREAAATELATGAGDYRDLYRVEDYAVQMPTFDLFVQSTWDGTEWATELTVSALACALGVVIRVVSSGTDNNGRPTASFLPYYNPAALDTGRIVTVAYNADEGHYLGLAC